jgi:hypothetical protein
MHLVLRVARAATFVGLSALWQDRFAELVALKVVQKNGTQHEIRIVKEGTMAGTNSADVNLSHLNPIPCDYHHKGIHTEAIQVTPENIGKLSLEFEKELFYAGDGRPYFVFDAQRGEDGSVTGEVTQLFVRVTDWIVPLRGEIHIYHDLTFWTTFDLPTAQVKMAGEEMKNYAIKDAQLVAATFGSTSESRDSTFLPNDRVRIKSTGEAGIVTVLSVDKGDGTYGIEVQGMTTGYAVYDPLDLEKEGAQLSPIKYVGETEVFPNAGDVDNFPQHRK